MRLTEVPSNNSDHIRGLASRRAAIPQRLVQAYIEITPFDSVKYEIDKVTGYLWVDRPQRSSSLPPVLYGFMPRTYCGPHVATLLAEVTQAPGDPPDICVLGERPIHRSEILGEAR